MKRLVQIDSDRVMAWDFFACKPGDAGLEVDGETFDRWRRIEGEWRAMQRELHELHDANPGTELGDRLPVDEEE